MYNFQIPSFASSLGNMVAEIKLFTTPKHDSIAPMVKLLSPSPPYGMDVARTRGMRTPQHCSMNARNM
jgi:hypothetical protein